MQYWIVKIGVEDCWVEDGFDFTEHYCENIGQELLPYSNSDEVTVKVLDAPDPATIAALQGE